MPTYRENPDTDQAGQPQVPMYDLACVTTQPGKPAFTQTTLATARPAAAWLRALANEIDPPPPPVKPAPATRSAPSVTQP